MFLGKPSRNLSNALQLLANIGSEQLETVRGTTRVPESLSHVIFQITLTAVSIPFSFSPCSAPANERHCSDLRNSSWWFPPSRQASPGANFCMLSRHFVATRRANLFGKYKASPDSRPRHPPATASTAFSVAQVLAGMTASCFEASSGKLPITSQPHALKGSNLTKGLQTNKYYTPRIQACNKSHSTVLYFHVIVAFLAPCENLAQAP